MIADGILDDVSELRFLGVVDQHSRAIRDALALVDDVIVIHRLMLARVLLGLVDGRRPAKWQRRGVQMASSIDRRKFAIHVERAAADEPAGHMKRVGAFGMIASGEAVRRDTSVAHWTEGPAVMAVGEWTGRRCVRLMDSACGVDPRRRAWAEKETAAQ